MKQGTSRTVRFGDFEADLSAGELKRSGLKLRLAGQPFEILSVLLERPGEVVTREELRARLWPDNTFVDYDHSLNAAINKLREALGDSAEEPRFVETLPRRGYRFVGRVDGAAAASAPVLLRERASLVEARSHSVRPSKTWRSAAVAAALVAVLALFLLLWHNVQSTTPRIQSLAVLPFSNLSNDPEQEYFADGMTEAVIARLSQIGALHVISRTSAMHYRGTKATLPQIAKELDVDAVVEGTVQRAGSRVTVTAHLVPAATDKSLWARTYERDLRDVLQLQGEVAGSIVDGIRVRVTPDEKLRLVRARPVDPEAYALYLQGRYYLAKSISWATVKAADFFRKAVRKDPNYALAWVGLAEAETFGYPPAESMKVAKEAALRAVALEPNLASAHAALGLVRTFHDWDWAGAEAAFRRALALDPNDSDIHYRFSHLLVATGRLDEAAAECRRALDLDPLSTNVGHNLGRIYYFARQYDRAIEQYQRTLQLDPSSYWSNFFLAKVYEEKGMEDDAMRVWVRVAALEGVPAEEIAEARRIYAASGYRAVARYALARFEKAQPSPALSSSAMAQRLAWLGRKDEAIQWLERAFASHTRDMIYMNVEPSFDALRTDPRFDAIVRRVGLPQLPTVHEPGAPLAR